MLWTERGSLKLDKYAKVNDSLHCHIGGKKKDFGEKKVSVWWFCPSGEPLRCIELEMSRTESRGL